jgi:hypothetical protein
VDRRPPDLWFVLAWGLLVVCITAAFIVQSRTIDRIDEQAEILNQLIVEEQREQDEGMGQLCGALVAISPETEDKRIVAAFKALGVECGAVD